MISDVSSVNVFWCASINSLQYIRYPVLTGAAISSSSLESSKMLSVCGQRIINWVFVRPTRPDAVTALNSKQATYRLPAGRRLLFPLLLAEKVPFPRATKEIGDVCTQATYRVSQKFVPLLYKSVTQ